MDFTFVGASQTDTFRWFSAGLREVMQSEGHRYIHDPNDARLVFNFFPEGSPRPFRRNAQAVFVCAVTEFPHPFTDHIAQAYPVLPGRWRIWPWGSCRRATGPRKPTS